MELELKANVLLKRIAMLGDDGNLKHWLVGAHLKQPLMLDLLVFYISTPFVPLDMFVSLFVSHV